MDTKELALALDTLGAEFDLIYDQVIITDKDGYILYANKGVERTTGFTKEEVLGKRPSDLWGGQMSKEFYENMWYTIKVEKKPFVGEVQGVRKDGTPYWQELHITPILNLDRVIIFFIGIEPDITVQKKEEFAQQEKNKKLEKVNNLISIFVKKLQKLLA